MLSTARVTRNDITRSRGHGSRPPGQFHLNASHEMAWANAMARIGLTNEEAVIGRSAVYHTDQSRL